METTRRLLVKAMTWQVLGLCMMTLIGYVVTGSVAAGSGIAVIGSVTGFICYFAHEVMWSKVAWGRPDGTPPAQKASPAGDAST